MGVKGLRTFFNFNPQLTKSYFLYNTPVIIDGNNLLFKLYFSYNLDCVYGGDFCKFSSLIKEYFTAFLECNIQPIVIFDGGLDKSNCKLDTILHRFKKIILSSKNIAKNKFSEKLLPINAVRVYKDVLFEMGITCAQCDFEADDQLPALASHFKCPIISDDSDFYIFDVQYGFIPLDSLKPYKVKRQVKGQVKNGLQCKIYYLHNLLSYFPGIDKSALALFGILMGNDYVHENVFDDLFMDIKLGDFIHKQKLNVDERRQKVVKLLCWLTQYTLDEAVKLIFSFLKGSHEENLKQLVHQALSSYANNNSNLIPIIEKTDLESLQFNTQMTTTCGKTLPMCFIYQFNTCTFPTYFLNVINLHKIFLQCQVEDDTFSSSYECSLYLRRVIYGILLHHNDENSVECEKEDCIRYVEEYYQQEGKIQIDHVTPVFTDKAQNALPMIDNLKNLDKESSKEILISVLNEKSDCLIHMPSHWKLYVLVVRYWLKNCHPKPSEGFICALIINMIHYNLLTKCSLKAVHCEFRDFSLKKLSKNIPLSEMEFTNFNLKKLKMYGSIDALKLPIIHSFSQLKTCINYVVDLNKLLGSPFRSIKIHQFVDGVLMYNLTQAMTSYPHSIDDFVTNITGLDSVVYTLFEKTKNILLEGACSSCFKKHKITPMPVMKSKKIRNIDVSNRYGNLSVVNL